MNFIKPPKNLVIRATIEFVVLTSILTFIGYFVYSNMDKMLKDSLEESVALQGKSIAVGLKNQFDEEFNKLHSAARVTEQGIVAISDLPSIFVTFGEEEELGVVTPDGRVLAGSPIKSDLIKDLENVFNGKDMMKFHNDGCGLVFAVPVKIDGQTCMLYNSHSIETVRKKFKAISYNGEGTIFLIYARRDVMRLSDGAEPLIDNDPEFKSGWDDMAVKIEANNDKDSWSLCREFNGKNYFLYVSWISKEYNFFIAGYAPWKAVAVGIDYVYMVMTVTFCIILIMIIFAVRYLMKKREAEKLAHEKVLADSANKAKSDFLSNMSHEIRTPINAIMGMDEMIIRESKDSNILEYAENLQNAARTLLGLVNDILDFSKIEAGKMEIIPVEYHVSSLLNDLVNMVQARAKKKGLEFITNVSQDVPSVLFGDEIRIKQVITNVLTNAVKYTESGSVTLNVDSQRINDEKIYLCVSISDTGIGIKQEDLKKLFSAFERIEEERNRTIEGTGLGMNITKKLLNLMGSQLQVESTYGEGSTFSFKVEQKVMNAEPIGDFQEDYKHSLNHHKEYHELFMAPDAKILVVDDTVMNLTVIKGLLKQTQIQIDTALNGTDCLTLVVKNKYDIIFLDHRMPGMDGIETLSAMKKIKNNINADTPIISLTANAITGAKEQYLSVGFQDYLTKPINCQQLEKLLIEYLPEEKIINVDENSIQSVQEIQESSLPDWLQNIEGLDTNEGINHCGSVEAYLDALTVFVESIITAADDIENYYKSEDLKNYITKVHALKSTAKVIGAMELSEKARRLEDAGNSGYINEIQQDTEPLLKLYRSYFKKLYPLIQDKSDEKTNKPTITDYDLNEAYEAMKDAATSFDYDTLMFVFQSLDDYKLPENEELRYQKIKAATTRLDWETINKLLSEV